MYICMIICICVLILSVSNALYMKYVCVCMYVYAVTVLNTASCCTTQENTTLRPGHCKNLVQGNRDINESMR